MSLDSFFVLNQNLSSLLVSTFFISVADDASFATNNQTIYSSIPADDNRVAALTLDHTATGPRRYSGVNYLRVGILFPSNKTPEIGEVVLGSRLQLAYNPDRPFDDLQIAARTDSFISQGGIRQTIERYKGQRIVNASFIDDDLTRIANIRSFYERTNYGTRPFIWCPLPSSAPEDFLLMQMPDAGLHLPREGANTRRWGLIAEEQGPESCFLSAE